MNARRLLMATQTEEQEVVWVLEPVKRACWRLLDPMARVGWTSSTTECLTLRRAVGVVQPWEWEDWSKNEKLIRRKQCFDLSRGVSS